MLRFAAPHEVKKFKNIRQVNVTSHAKDIFRNLSPFLLGPVKLYGEHVAQNVENGWQFAKLYPEHADAIGNLTARYYSWARAGINCAFDAEWNPYELPEWSELFNDKVAEYAENKLPLDQAAAWIPAIQDGCTVYYSDIPQTVKIKGKHLLFMLAEVFISCEKL